MSQLIIKILNNSIVKNSGIKDIKDLKEVESNFNIPLMNIR